MTFDLRLDHFALGLPPLLAMRWPSATGLTSYLSGCFSSHNSGVVCNIAGILEGFYKPCLGCVSFPVLMLTLSRLSASFFGPALFSKTARATRTVLMHSSNLYLSVTAIRSGLKPA